MRIGRVAMLALAVLFIPVVASAGLLGDTVSASLVSNPSSTIFSGNAVVGGGIEFSAIFQDAAWTLDISDTGFRLEVTCADDASLGCSYPDGLTFSISGLDFTPPATLIGLTGVTHDDSLVPVSFPPTPTFTPSSVSISFEDFSLATGGSTGDNKTAFYEATFETQAQAPLVPLPGTLALLSAGLGLAALALRRPRA